MAGSRAEKIKTVFSRVQGLLQTGALKESDKPVWYEVYAAFPPRVEPKYERAVRTDEPINVLYREDAIRAKFYNTFVQPDVIDMRQKDVSSVCQRFVEKHQELERSNRDGLDGSQLVNAVVDALKADGITLKTIAQLQQERDAARKAKESRSSASIHQAAAVTSLRSLPSIDELFDVDVADEVDETKNSKKIIKQNSELL
jgi:small subunit ribosomal protein S23